MNIWCVGRNYVDHAKELNNPLPEKPLIFLKAGSCLTREKSFTLPTHLGEIHHECELALKLDAQGQPSQIGLALDLTARAVQADAKKKGEPWTLAKSFKEACPISDFIDFQDFSFFESLSFHFSVNGQIVQKGGPKDFIFPLPTLLKTLKENFPLAPGDLLLTGTPAGVGPLRKGDRLDAEILGHLSMTWNVI